MAQNVSAQIGQGVSGAGLGNTYNINTNTCTQTQSVVVLAQAILVHTHAIHSIQLKQFWSRSRHSVHSAQAPCRRVRAAAASAQAQFCSRVRAAAAVAQFGATRQALTRVTSADSAVNPCRQGGNIGKKSTRSSLVTTCAPQTRCTPATTGVGGMQSATNAASHTASSAY